MGNENQKQLLYLFLFTMDVGDLLAGECFGGKPVAAATSGSVDGPRRTDAR